MLLLAKNAVSNSYCYRPILMINNDDLRRLCRRRRHFELKIGNQHEHQNYSEPFIIKSYTSKVDHDDCRNKTMQ